MPRLVSPLALALILSACGPERPVLIALASPQSVDQPSVAVVARLALDSAPGPTRVELSPWTLFDGAVERHTDQAKKFAADPGVSAVVGHAGSRDALLGATIYNRVGVPQVVPTATSRRLRDAGPWTFTMVPNDSIEGDFIAAYAVDSVHVRRPAIFYLGDEYGIGLRDGIRAGLLARGLPLVDEVLIPSQQCQAGTRLSAEVYTAIARAAVIRHHPDAAILATGTLNGWCLVREVHALDSAIWILAGDGLEVGGLPQPGGYNRNRVVGVNFWVPGTDSLSRVFVDRSLRLLHRMPTPGEALTYDAFLLLQHAIQEVGPSRRRIRSYLESLGRTRDPVPGVTGPIAFDKPRMGVLHMSPPREEVP